MWSGLGIFRIVLGILLKDFRFSGGLCCSQHGFAAAVATHSVTLERRIDGRRWHGDDRDDSTHDSFLNSF